MTIEYPPIDPPSGKSRFKELGTPLQFIAELPRWRRLRSFRSAKPQTVVLMPGFGWSETSMAVLGRALRRLGHRVYGWGLGRNDGHVPNLLARVSASCERIADEAGEPIVAVGWSLGGYLAREAARDRPDHFVKVITMGSPVIGGPRFTVAAGWYVNRGWSLDEIERDVAERFAEPLAVPVTAIYSKFDGIVAWQACIDRWSPNVEHIEVKSTHVGLGFSPIVIQRVAAAID